jgi:hypothetical protein
MLLKLKKKALDAEKAYNAVQDRIFEWDKIVECSDNLTKVLDLNIAKESKAFIKNLTKFYIDLNQTYVVLKVKRDNLVLEYALAKLGGKLGDLVEYIDMCGRERVITIEGVQLMEGRIFITGTRLLKTGKIGIRSDYVCLDTFSWNLRSSHSSTLR